VDREADLEVVDRSTWIWGSKNRLATSLGMKRIEFAGKHIHKMGIKLEKITYTPCSCNSCRLPRWFAGFVVD
jgi:hypothetical protein